MNPIDFSKYTIEELKASLRSIDREKYPERVIEIQNILEAKLADPLIVIENQLENNFFAEHVPGEVVTGVWLRVIGWGFLFSAAIIFPVVLLLSLVMNAMGYQDDSITSTTTVVSWLFSIAMSWLVTRKALGAKLDSYEIVFYKKEK